MQIYMGNCCKNVYFLLSMKDYFIFYSSVFSLQFGGVEEDGDGAIVDEIDFHIGTETTGFDLETVHSTEGVIEVVIQRRRLFGTGGTDKGRTVAFPAVGIQGELGDTEDSTADVTEREVHLAFRVLKDTELGNLLRQEIGIGLRIRIGDTHQEHEALADRTDLSIINAHFGARTSLYYNPHDQ